MNLTQLHQAVRRYHKRMKRVGRGDSSGHGGTSTRGGKGQSARSGYHTKNYFEGGQMPLIRKTPKRGFRNKRFADVVIVVNLRDLNKFENGDIINPAKLYGRGIIKGEYDQIKILGKGTLEKEGLTVEAHSFSKSAAKIIAEKKGKVIWMNPPPVEIKPVIKPARPPEADKPAGKPAGGKDAPAVKAAKPKAVKPASQAGKVPKEEKAPKEEKPLSQSGETKKEPEGKTSPNPRPNDRSVGQAPAQAGEPPAPPVGDQPAGQSAMPETGEPTNL